MKVTIEPTQDQSRLSSKYPKVTIEYEDDIGDIKIFSEDILRPMLAAWGFHTSLIDQLLNDE